MNITLNEGQALASERLSKFLVSPINHSQPARYSNRYINLCGGGGTGKTTSIFVTLEPFRQKGYRILLTAPTNKAVRVLRDSARKFGVEYECVTLAKALGLALLPDEEERRIVPAGKPIIGTFDILVVDEESMVSSRTLDVLERAVDQTNVKIIGMGDDYQLPPVKESRSEMFDLGEKITLTKVERYSGPILNLSNELRSCIDNKRRLKSIVPAVDPTTGTGVRSALGPKFVKQALELVDPDNTDHCRLLAWTNRRVDELNHAVRQHFHGKKVPEFIVGDRVVTVSAVKSETSEEILLPVDEECVVKAVMDSTLQGAFDTSQLFPAWTLVLEPVHSPGSDVVVNVLKKNAVDDWFGHLKEVATYARKTGDWTLYWGTRESAHQIRHCYAITVHRSQGSTFQNVFLDVIDIQRNKKLMEQLKLMYVGASRPAHQLFVNRERFIAA